MARDVNRMDWRSRVNALDESERHALTERLDKDLLGGWFLIEGENDYNVSGEELVELLEAAMDQHEQDDVDVHAEGSRRKADERVLSEHLEQVEDQTVDRLGA